MKIDLYNEDHNNISKIMKYAINSDLYTKRLPYIRQMKKKLLEKLGFFHRISIVVCIEVRFIEQKHFSALILQTIAYSVP